MEQCVFLFVLAPQQKQQSNNTCVKGKYRVSFFTQHARLPFQQRQDVLVEKQGAEAEEVPEAQVGEGAPVPDPRLGLDHRGLCDGDLQHLLPRQALAAGQQHSLLPGAKRRQEAPQRVPGGVPATWHHGRGLAVPRVLAGDERRDEGGCRWLVHLLTGAAADPSRCVEVAARNFSAFPAGAQ